MVIGYLYSLLWFIVAVAGWLAYFKAAPAADLIALPLKSYLLPVKVSINSYLHNSPSWALTAFGLKLDLHYKLINEIFICSLIILSLLGFIYILKNIQSYSRRQIIIWGLIAGFCSMIALPGDSSDLFGYIARAYEQTHYHLNPYQFVISDIDSWSSDPFLHNIQWINNPSPYGPLFMLLIQFLSKLSSGNFFLSFFIFKFFSFGIFVILLWVMNQNLKDDKIFAAFALNPFLLTQGLWNAHNDLLMGLLICLSAVLAERKSFNWAFLCLTLSTLIKYISLVLLPVLLIYAYRHRKIPWIGAIASFVITASLIIYYDLLNADFSKISSNITLSHKSLFHFVNSIYLYFSGEQLPSISRSLMLIGFACFASWYYFKIYKEQKNNIFKSKFWILFALILIASPKFHSWYLLSLLPLGFIAEPQLVILLSSFHLFSLTFIDQANVLNFVVMSLIPIVIFFITKKQSIQ